MGERPARAELLPETRRSEREEVSSAGWSGRVRRAALRPLATGLVAPGLPLRTPVSFIVAAIVVSGLVGLASGVLPARRASTLDPVKALNENVERLNALLFAPVDYALVARR